ncbi:nuclear mitotic apparatus protein 1-like [Varanus komodoensis]|uniref:nuclear mitotic apparatus protein 1-like n=1 Tax=Varanus komodoensis TaxID=61221 RepID=UPI001CF79A15|nr:nuclear mitotic apparatus protein 1-like [Varanus komodoensis]
MDNQNNFCRLCGAMLRGNQRRWLFGRSSSNSRPDLLVVLSFVLNREPPRRGDGRGEFLCGKCAQALARVYRFDTVIARVQALSIERLQRLLSEKDQLARSLRHIHARQFPDDNISASYVDPAISTSIADLPHVRYQRLLQDDMALSEYECWANDASSSSPGMPCRNRRCRSCHGLRVADSDYEWVCQTPRQLGTFSPVLPLCRDKSQSMPTVHRVSSQVSLRSQSLGDAESCLGLSLDTSPEPDLVWEALQALMGIRRKHLRAPAGSRIPVLAGGQCTPTPRRESPLGQDAFEDVVDEFVPVESKLHVQQRLQQSLQEAFDHLKERLDASAEELRSFRKKQGEAAGQEADILHEKHKGSQERLIQQLSRCLQSKEEVLQGCLLILQSLESARVEPVMLESQIRQMAQRLKERDRAFEKTLSSQFLALESLHRELRQLREALKDKDADLARLNTVARTGEETLHALREVLHQKDREIQRLESLSSLTRESWHQHEQVLLLSLKEKETLIKALQEALSSSTQDVQTLANSLGSPDLAPKLLQQIQEKEALLAQSLAEQEQIQAQWQERLQATEAAAAVREQVLQEQLHQCSQDAQERSREAEKLRKCVAQAQAELADGATVLEECRAELAQLRGMEDMKNHALEKALREGQEKDRILRTLQQHLLRRMKWKPVEKGEICLPLT